MNEWMNGRVPWTFRLSKWNPTRRDDRCVCLCWQVFTAALLAVVLQMFFKCRTYTLSIPCARYALVEGAIQEKNLTTDFSRLSLPIGIKPFFLLSLVLIVNCFPFLNKHRSTNSNSSSSTPSMMLCDWIKIVCATVCVVPNWSTVKRWHSTLVCYSFLRLITRKIFFGIRSSSIRYTRFCSLAHSHSLTQSCTLHAMYIYFWRLGQNISYIYVYSHALANKRFIRILFRCF